MHNTAQTAKQLTAPDILEAKGKRKLAMMTAYDYPAGCQADQAGMDMILVGDSLAMVVLGHEDTLSVTVEEMLHHTKAVSRGVQHALVLGDLPFGSYQSSVAQAVATGTRFLAEGGARAVKLEGGRSFAPHIRAMVQAGIPVMGHIGLTPQYMATLGGFRYQGKTAEAIQILIHDAQALVEAGIFALVLEAMPAEAAQILTETVSVPTIGIGAGAATDGQVLVYHDVLGLFERFTPKFVKQYVRLGDLATENLRLYAEEVRAGDFPGKEQSIFLAPEELEKLKSLRKSCS